MGEAHLLAGENSCVGLVVCHENDVGGATSHTCKYCMSKVKLTCEI
jgi:hypothetical protein